MEFTKPMGSTRSWLEFRPVGEADLLGSVVTYLNDLRICHPTRAGLQRLSCPLNYRLGNLIDEHRVEAFSFALRFVGDVRNSDFRRIQPMDHLLVRFDCSFVSPAGNRLARRQKRYDNC